MSTTPVATTNIDVGVVIAYIVITIGVVVVLAMLSKVIIKSKEPNILKILLISIGILVLAFMVYFIVLFNAAIHNS